LAEQVSDASPIAQPWMADAAARIARDWDLNAAAARVAAGLPGSPFGAAPWRALVSAADGSPFAVVAASANRLLVASATPGSDLATPVLLRSIANAMASMSDLRRAEVVPIADAALQRWSRPASPVTSPRIGTVEQDDRRWLWLAVLGLLALESRIRRPRTDDGLAAGQEERAHVA
jgi:hypothetical protein